MNNSSILIVCSITLAAFAGCSKAGSSNQDESPSTTLEATIANPAIERPRYYPDEDGTDANSDALTITEELARDFAPNVSEVATFDGFETFLTN